MDTKDQKKTEGGGAIASSDLLGNWQPMETAPKDGTLVLLACRTVEIGRWDDDEYARKPRPFWKRYSVFGVSSERANQPVAWMPLPKLPNRVDRIN